MGFIYFLIDLYGKNFQKVKTAPEHTLIPKKEDIKQPDSDIDILEKL